MNDGRHVLIVGGGVIGLACAHYLQQSGLRVTVVDKSRIGSGCSQSNCGLVCPSHVLPLAEPGAVRTALAATLSPRGAMRVRPRLDPEFWRWSWRFAKRCNHTDMLASGRAIQPLLTSSMELYSQLIDREGLHCEWTKQGLLFVYRTPEVFEKYAAVNELVASQFNERAQKLDHRALLDFEPALRPGLAGAWYFEHDAHLKPERLLSSWSNLLRQRGVTFLENNALQQLIESAGVVSAARLERTTISADVFLIATGAWTPQLGKLLGVRIPIEPGKGYSITIARPTPCPKTPMIFPEQRVAVTPWQRELRLGSMMELVGFDSSIRLRRLRLLMQAASHYLRASLPAEYSEQWFGWRPLTYDSAPVIDACPGFSNVYLATGHNMLGLSMAPATGRLVSEMITRQPLHVSAEPYAVGRFNLAS